MSTPINIAGIPAELKALPQFITWKYNAAQRKLPCAVDTGKVADAHAPSSHGTFDAAVAAYRKRHHAGIGFDFTPNDPYTGIDLDDCIAEDGTVKPIAAAIIATMQTYTEISPSGKGVKMWVRGHVQDSVTPTPLGDGIKVEIYSEARFFTMTGHRLEGTPAEIRGVDYELTTLYLQARPPRPAQPQQPRTALVIAPDTDHARRYALAALESEHQSMQAAGDGERHNIRLRAAYALAGYIPHITEDEITQALAINFGPDEASARKTIADGIAAGKEEPRMIPEPDPAFGLKIGTKAAQTTSVDVDELQRLRDENTRLHGRLQWMLLTLGNEHIPTGQRITTVFTRIEIEDRRELGQEDQPVRVWKIAKESGQSPDVVGTHIKRLATCKAWERRVERTYNPNTQKPETAVYVQPQPALYQPRSIQPPEPSNWGGKRETCKHCGSDKLVKEVRVYCAECETVHHESIDLVNKPMPQDAGSEDVAAEQAEEAQIEITVSTESPMPQLAGSEEQRDEHITKTVAIPMSGVLPDRVKPPMPQLAGSQKPAHQAIIFPSRYKALAAQRAATQVPT